MKRTLLENVSSISGDINTDKAVRAIITHRNTPSQDTGVSPAEVLFGHKLRDRLPNKFQKTRRDWHSIDKARKNKIKEKSKRDKPSGRVLRPLKIGDAVRIQNQVGNHPKKWSSTGKVVEVRPHRQYKVVKDGTRRVTLRNRKFLRKTSNEDRTSRHPDVPKKVVEIPIQKPSDGTRSPVAQRSQESPQSRGAVSPGSPRSTQFDSTPLDSTRSPVAQNSQEPPQIRGMVSPGLPISRALLELADHNNRGLKEDALNEKDGASKRYPTRKREKTKRYTEQC
jgi:hypothetical protein